MVLKAYTELSDIYESTIKKSASGRLACSVMILCANEVDAMSSTRMLTQHLRDDNIAYTVRPVSNFDQIKQNYKQRTESIKIIFMINCGAVYNIKKAFDLEGADTQIYIMDNHRPIHQSNIHSRNDVQVIVDSVEVEKTFTIDSDDESLYSEPESNSEDDDDDDDDDEDDDDEDDDSDSGSDDKIDEEDGELSEEGEEGNDEDGNIIDVDDANEDGDEDNQQDDDDESGGDDDDDDDEEEEEEEDDDDDDDNDKRNSADEDNNDGEEMEEEEEANNDGEGSEIEGEDRKKIKINNKINKKRKIKLLSSSKSIDGEDDGDDDDINNNIDNGFNDDENDDDENDDGENDDGENDDDDDENVVMKRRRRIDPVKQRKKNLIKYYHGDEQYSWPTSFMILNLVWGQRKSLDSIWQAIIGITDQYHRYRMSEESYEDLCRMIKVQLQDHLDNASNRIKYTVGDGDQQVVVPGAETGHIEEGKEFRFFMHRHWSLFDAMYYSPYIATKIQVWTTEGITNLNELLAKIGLPLQQCKQSYNFINPTLRKHFHTEILKHQKDYKLENPGLMFISFFRYNSFKNPVSATDVVFSSSALLELCKSVDIDENINFDKKNAFNEAYDCLSMKSDELLKKGISATLTLQKTIVKRATILLEGNEIKPMYRLHWAYINTKETNITTSNTGSVNSEIDTAFSRPLVISKLGHYIMDVKREIKEQGWGKNRNGKLVLLPLILLARRNDVVVVVGISPLNSTMGITDVAIDQINYIKEISNFRYYFRKACDLSGINYKKNRSFDSNILEFEWSDGCERDFIGNLDFLLKKVETKAN